MKETSSPDAATPEPAHHRRPSAIVAIGASAGGLDSLKKFFAQVPDNTGIAYVVLQHLAPDHSSILAEILARHTSLKVLTAAEGITVEPDVVYVLPPATDLRIGQGVLHLSAADQTCGLRMPIDAFMRSLAADQRENAVGVILSGTGSDGTQGIREIKECGGLVMVQRPDEVVYDEMPRSAVRTGQADYVLAVDRLAPALVRYVQHNELFDDRGAQSTDYSRPLEAILHILRSQTEHDFRDYKYSTLLRRIQRRMGLKSGLRPALRGRRRWRQRR
jgi:two-component system CheB/CheR fusion protein